jgi:tetraacyldisaccharide-1-P 4'-kinase
MLTARKVALRVNGVRTANARVRRVQKGLELVITDPQLGEFAADENFTLELLELVHPHEIRRRLPNGGLRKVSLRMLIALLGSGVVRVVEES